VFVLVLKHQANRSLLHLGGKFGLPHGSILSSDGASWKAGAVHTIKTPYTCPSTAPLQRTSPELVDGRRPYVSSC
jgi:hypothetical protein